LLEEFNPLMGVVLFVLYRSLALDLDGNMYVAERQGNRIRQIENKTGQVRTVTKYRYTHMHCATSCHLT
jgi:hypothetical protein